MRICLGVETVTPMQRVLTEVTGTIVEIVKPDSQIGPLGSSIAFRVSGGEVDKGDHVERYVALGEPKLVAGREYLVALNWEQHENAFFPSFGPNSIFDVTNGVVVSHRETALAAKVKGLTLRQLIAQMTTPPAPSKWGDMAHRRRVSGSAPVSRLEAASTIPTRNVSNANNGG
jgi:hypothetical protein